MFKAFCSPSQRSALGTQGERALTAGRGLGGREISLCFCHCHPSPSWLGNTSTHLFASIPAPLTRTTAKKKKSSRNAHLFSQPSQWLPTDTESDIVLLLVLQGSAPFTSLTTLHGPLACMATSLLFLVRSSYTLC